VFFVHPQYYEGAYSPRSNKIKGENMKVRFKNLIGGYTGTADDSVIYFNPGLNRYIVRSKPKHKSHSGNSKFSDVARSLKQLCPAEEYISDFKAYLKLYNRLPAHREAPLPVWNNLWVKMMWSMHNIYGIELAGITRQQIMDNNLPCKSVKAAVEAGLLPKVVGWEGFDALM
jgi:hypothetical protein